MSKTRFTSISTAICVEDALKSRNLASAIEQLRGLVDDAEVAELEAGYRTVKGTTELLLRIWYSSQEHSQADCAQAILDARNSCAINARCLVTLSKAHAALSQQILEGLLTLEEQKLAKLNRRSEALRVLMDMMQRGVAKFRSELARFEAEVREAYAERAEPVDLTPQSAGSSANLRLLTAAV